MAKYNRSMQVEGKLTMDQSSYAAGIRHAIRNTEKLKRAAKDTAKNNGFRQMGRAALGAAAGIGAITIATDQLRRSVTDTVDLAKATRQLQRATGLASEEASALAGVLKVRGVGTDKLGRSFTTLARNVEAAKTGVGGAAEAFGRLGVSQKAIESGNINRILVEASDGFQRLGDGTSKAAIAQQLFGRNSRDLIPLLEGGSARLKEQLALAPQLSDAQVRQSLATVNAQRQIQLAMLNVRTTIGTALMPVLSRGADKLAKFIKEMKTGKGEGGKFADQVKKIWQSIKPAAEQLAKFAKAAFNFAAENPGLVKVAASLAAIGLAIKGIRFLSAISGLTTFLNVAKGLSPQLRKLFARSGARAGTAFAGEAAGGMAGNMASSLAPSGRLGKMGSKSGKFAKWGGRMGKAAKWAFIAGFTYLMVEAIGDKMGNLFDKVLDAVGLGPNDPHGDRSGQDLSDPNKPLRGKGLRDYNNYHRRGMRRRMATPMARGSDAMRFRRRAPRLPRPSLDMARGSIADLRGMDPLTGGVPVEARLQRAEGRAASAQYRADRYRTAAGDNRTRAETKRLRQLTAAAREAQREVTKLQRQLDRRDALLEIRQQFQEFRQGFVDAYATGLQNIADARLTAAQTLAEKVLNTQLKNLDEEEGQSEEARRLRELRTQQELDAKAREDEQYAKDKLALETDLERAIRNGNVRGQAELRAQIEALDEQRRETLRNREISDLSDSLQRQRSAAQADYEARVGAAQDYYDRQLELNRQATEDYKTEVEAQFRELQAKLEAGRINYAEFYQRVSQLGANLTTSLQGELDTRATDELAALRNSESAYGTYVTNVNAVLAGIRNQIEPPQIPPIPQIDVNTVLKIQRIDGLPSGWNLTPSDGGGSTGGTKRFTQDEAFAFMKKNYPKRKETSKPTLRNLANFWGWSKDEVLKFIITNRVRALMKKNNIDVVGRASGGPLSRSSLTMVGETGPELITAGPNGPQVMSATRTARAGGGVTLNVYPQTTADDPVALARALGWQLANR